MTCLSDASADSVKKETSTPAPAPSANPQDNRKSTCVPRRAPARLSRPPTMPPVPVPAPARPLCRCNAGSRRQHLPVVAAERDESARPAIRLASSPNVAMLGDNKRRRRQLCCAVTTPLCREDPPLLSPLARGRRRHITPSRRRGNCRLSLLPTVPPAKIPRASVNGGAALRFVNRRMEERENEMKRFDNLISLGI